MLREIWRDREDKYHSLNRDDTTSRNVLTACRYTDAEAVLPTGVHRAGPTVAPVCRHRAASCGFPSTAGAAKLKDRGFSGPSHPQVLLEDER